MSGQQQIGAIGIDLGSSRSVIGVAKKKGVDVICNQASNRETANIVGFGEKERYMGEQGLARAKSNFKNTCSFSNRLIGLSSDYPHIKEESKWITSKFLTNEAGELVYDVVSKGEKKQFTPVQVTASMLGELRKIVTHNDINDKEAVISVPSYYTEQEKKALLDAAKIADLKVARLLSESSAITLSYGLFRKNDLPEKDAEPRNVAFVDFGHSKFSAFVSSFTKDKCKVLLQQNERHLGSRDFDWTLLKFYDELFQKSSGGLSILENKKAILRSLDAIQKQRKILSANQHAAISAECLVEDEDLNYDMNREEFEKLIQPDLNRIKEQLELLAAQIKEKNITIHSLEIVGCATRTPAVQQLIKDVLGYDIFRTLNQSECIARGCAMMAAYLSPQFRVAEYQLEECNSYPISIRWDFLNRGEMIEEGKSAVFFQKGCTIPNIKSLTFRRSDGIQLNFFYDSEITGFKREIGSFTIAAFDHKEEDYNLKIRVKLNINGIVELTETALIENYKVEEKIKKPKKTEEKKPSDKNDKKDDKKDDNKEDEEEFEIKIKDKIRTTQLPNNVTQLYYLNSQQVDAQFNIEQEMSTHDRIILETNAKKNELETYIYESRDRLGGKYKAFVDPSTFPEIESKLNTHSSWLDDEGYESSKGQYVTRIEELEALIEPIGKRFIQYEHLPQTVTNINSVLQTAEEFVASTDEKFAHISVEERQPIQNEIISVKQQLSDAQAKQQALQQYQDPVITVEQIEALGNTLINLSKPIMSKAVPKPKEEAKKTEENKEEQKEQNKEGEATEQKQEENQDKEAKTDKIEEE